MKKEFARDYLAGRVILITGATKGLGRQTALTCAAHGATVVLVARNVKRLEAVYDEIVAAGGPEPAAIPLDLYTALEPEFNSAAQQIQSALGRLDGIVHCASYLYAVSPLADQGIDEWMHQYRINTVAPHALTRACLPLLSRSPDASVLFVGETHGLHPGAYWGGFGASKAGLVYLTKVAASEWDDRPNLRVNLLVPGSINSPLRMKTHPGEDRSERAELSDAMPWFLYWLGSDSTGRSGQIIELDLRRRDQEGG
ncbi:SDR family oxidoreductase [Paludibacterium purpuratum]|uniref:NAD(P)-dependent dehydrogenase (Short-subunit alcohol dehydrogenase family) n=1 Tax=Paludibacterium purpuratum TaxID=1144873 RepID=A0A4R7BDD2_9NEIS|nr:SDR family oxidoreductase [Paludibacterium purpuratum]TDR81975.1 NAD(P)-dependent dehydrogenase (short-subunit alcohol dehydrogenase family) [Paludibacterium purpuratum]